MFSAFGEAESRALEGLSGPLLPLHCTGSAQGGKVRTGDCGRWSQNPNQKNPMQAGGDICAGNIAPPPGFSIMSDAETGDLESLHCLHPVSPKGLHTSP